jgi:hypothetical protein
MKSRLLLAALLLLLGLSAPSAQLSLMGIGGADLGSAAAQPTGDILLVDGVSFILQTDAASLICRAGGC